jgi:hypothetical protein
MNERVVNTDSGNPWIAHATPRPEEVWRVYLNGKIKVRELNSGIVQVAVGDKDWTTLHE